ncbi:hypothetical protein DID76_00990 [Candidatus Marinamargulisbacteria bacterium SCGC AG-414-C22]|nr:hypothetical protein DID76_00990 [Candidatus Marinamargulisbacteria bacterium SCGC AG-414-C22]
MNVQHFFRKLKTKKIVKFHSILGVSFSVFIIILSISGFFLNNDSLISSNNISKNPYEQHPEKTFLVADNDFFLKTRHGLYKSNDMTSYDVVRTPFSIKYLNDIVFYKDFYWFSLSNGVLYKMKQGSRFMNRVNIPELNVINNLNVYGDVFLMHSDVGLFQFTNNNWRLLQANHSPYDLKALFLALHLGIYPFAFLKSLNNFTALFLIVLTVSGIYLFIKKTIKSF